MLRWIVVFGYAVSLMRVTQTERSWQRRSKATLDSSVSTSSLYKPAKSSNLRHSQVPTDRLHTRTASSIRSSPRPPRSGHKKPQLMYDLPKLDDKENRPLSTSRRRSSVPRQERDTKALTAALGLNTPSSRHSFRDQDTPTSPTLSEAYSYVYAYGLSEPEGNQPLVAPLKRSRTIVDDDKSVYPPTPELTLSPTVNTAVGAMMLTSYGEEGGLSSPSLPRFDSDRQGRKIRNGAGKDPIIFNPRYTRVPTQYRYQQNVPSLPPPGMPSLQQMALMREMPDYRSPTYSVYGMYKEGSDSRFRDVF